jgi:hypothetical protein
MGKDKNEMNDSFDGVDVPSMVPANTKKSKI